MMEFDLPFRGSRTVQSSFTRWPKTVLSLHSSPGLQSHLIQQLTRGAHVTNDDCRKIVQAATRALF
ncbi:hypothetical protein M3J09_013747 [Ascochyta lentis]